MNYDEFIASKKTKLKQSGFEPETLNNHLFPFQKYCVTKALKSGRYAIFSDCGTGKTIMQLEWAHHVAIHTRKPVLILCPLAVSGQTINEGAKFGIEVERWSKGNEAQSTLNHLPMIMIANYEKLENISTDIFSGVVLDESSILKNFTGKYKNLIIDLFAQTPYKLACTATPAPNDPMELGNHTEFLNVMSRNEMLAMYFVHDGGETAKWRLKKHAQKDFFRFIGSWCIMMQKPSDVGFEEEGYDLPPLEYFERQVVTDKKNNGKLFNDISVNATSFNKELRLTIAPRMDIVSKIVNNSKEPFIVWVNQNTEEDAILKMIPDAKAVRGSENTEAKEKKLLGFANGDFRVLVTKKKIAQFGLNYQHCRNQVFASLDFSFEGLYQAIRRSYRFGQKQQVNIYLISTDTMQNVVNSLKEKQSKYEQMHTEMTKTINEASKEKRREYDTASVSNENYRIERGDCVKLIGKEPDESVGFSIFSPPFAQLYVYSDEVADMGNSKDYADFLIAFNFMVKDLYRIMKSGRNVAVHCMDLPIQKGKEGFIGLRDFSGMIREAFESVGFIYHSRVTIWKDPVIEMQRTKALGLLHKQIKKDSTMSRVGIPDYLMIFRKDGERLDPVRNEDMPVDLWQKIASPVWMDINYSNTLQFRNARDNNDEKHICPLQLETIERAIHLYTNKGDTVFTPFMGIGSEVYQAVKMNRKGLGFELKESYFQAAKKNLQNVIAEKSQMTLFE